MSNSLLENHVLPPFSKITPADVKEAIPFLVERNLKEIDSLLAKNLIPTWENLLRPIEQFDDELSQAWSPVSHLNSVVNTPELREAYHYCLPKLTDYGIKIGQNQKLYDAYCALRVSNSFVDFDPAQQMTVIHAIVEFQLSGVGLSPEERQKFSDLKQALSKLESAFQDNVMDVTDAWHLTVQDEARLKGIPGSSLALAKQAAEKAHENGWRLTLDYPCYSAVITYAEDRALRQQLHEAYLTRASDQGPHDRKWDNTENIEKILALRHELAKLLGYKNFAERSLVKKMANTPEEVIHFLVELAERTKPFAEKEWQELEAFAKSMHGIDQLEPWDIPYYSEKLRQKKFAISQEALREYFPAPTVIAGLFEVAERLFDIHIEEESGVETWHPDVQFFTIFDANRNRRGMFYLDLYARNQKRSGAWMDEARVMRRLENGKLQVPVAYLTCNFQAPIEGRPSLLTHDEVTTLFHEFGHGLHHMLTKIEYPSVSGINGVPWDVVEVPSQFLENWCWQDEVLAFLSSHYKTGEVLSKEWLEKMRRAKNFQSAMMLIRQIEFSLFDFKIHFEYDPTKGGRIDEILRDLRQRYSVTPHAPYARFAHSFSHVFSGGYAAGYYSYLWAEVLACDAFSKFEEEGIFNAATGKAFLEKVLEVGGSVEPRIWFENFRGRPPKLEALLKQHGIE